MSSDLHSDNFASDHNQDNVEPEYIHISKEDIFHADPATIFLRRLLGVIYLFCGIGMIVIATNFSPHQSGSNYSFLYCLLGILLAFCGVGFFVGAWHKRSYRSFINEQGIGCSNSHNIPAHAWHEVDYVLQRLYYWGTPPNNGVWGVAPRRLDEDYVVVLKTGERLFFGRRNLGHLSRFKPLILYYTEQNNVEWKTQDIYHSRRLKAGKKLIPTLIAVFLIFTPIALVLTQGALIYGIQNHLITLTEQQEKEIQAARFSWPIEFLERKAQQINQYNDPGSIQPLNIRLASMYIDEDGSTVAIGTDAGAFLLRDITTNIEIGSIPNAQLSAVVFTMFSEDKTKAITRDFDNQLQVWDINKQQEIFTLEVPNKYYRSAVFSADGKFIFSGDLEGHVSVCNLESGDADKKLSGIQKVQHGVTYVYASKDGQKVVAGFESNAVFIWDLFMKGEPIVLNLDSQLVCTAFTADNKDLGTLEKNGTFKIWNYAVRQDTFSKPIVSSNQNERFEQFAFSHSGKAVVFGSNMGTVCLYSIAKSKELEKLTVPGMESPTPIKGIAFTPDDAYIVVGTKYGIWKIRVNSLE